MQRKFCFLLKLITVHKINRNFFYLHVFALLISCVNSYYLYLVSGLELGKVLGSWVVLHWEQLVLPVDQKQPIKL